MELIGLSFYRQRKYSYARNIFEECKDDKCIYYLAKIYFLGLQTTIDYQKAYLYFKLAAENGYSKAFYYLGYYCHLGLLQKADWTKALNFYKQSLDYHESLTAIAEIYNCSSEEMLAKYFFKQSLSIKITGYACFKLGIFYLQEKKLNKALNVFLQGASKKNGQCCTELAELIPEKKKKYLYRAIEYGDYYACLELSKLVSVCEAQRLLKTAYFKGDVIYALQKLADLYRYTYLGKNRKQVIHIFCKINQAEFLQEIYGYTLCDIRRFVKLFILEQENYYLCKQNKLLRAHINASPDGSLFYSSMEHYQKLSKSL